MRKIWGRGVNWPAMNVWSYPCAVCNTWSPVVFVLTAIVTAGFTRDVETEFKSVDKPVSTVKFCVIGLFGRNKMTTQFRECLVLVPICSCELSTCSCELSTCSCELPTCSCELPTCSFWIGIHFLVLFPSFRFLSFLLPVAVRAWGTWEMRTKFWLEDPKGKSWLRRRRWEDIDLDL
jgi:hypothetical protein